MAYRVNQWIFKLRSPGMRTNGYPNPRGYLVRQIVERQRRCEANQPLG